MTNPQVYQIKELREELNSLSPNQPQTEINVNEFFADLTQLLRVLAIWSTTLGNVFCLRKSYISTVTSKVILTTCFKSLMVSRVSKDSPKVSIGIYQISQIFKGLQRSEQVSKGLNRSPKVSAGLHKSSKISNRSQQVFIGLKGSQQVIYRSQSLQRFLRSQKVLNRFPKVSKTYQQVSKGFYRPPKILQRNLQVSKGLQRSQWLSIGLQGL